MDAKPRDRVATPAEFAELLDALALEDALPFALAGYGTARKQEIRTLDWSHVDLKLGAIELAADEEGRKPGGSWRVVPLVKPLRAMLREAWIAQGRPTEGKVCPPRQYSPSGPVALGHLQESVHRDLAQARARADRPPRVPPHRSDLARPRRRLPKVASQLMGHKTPDYQPGAAPITLRRYTHTLPGRARAGPRSARHVPGGAGRPNRRARA